MGIGMNDDAGGFDAIVIGSCIGGLACACALTRSGLKVLVLERHVAAGGLTQTFSTPDGWHGTTAKLSYTLGQP